MPTEKCIIIRRVCATWSAQWSNKIQIVHFFRLKFRKGVDAPLNCHFTFKNLQKEGASWP
jgi:hypothetical protein